MVLGDPFKACAQSVPLPLKETVKEGGGTTVTSAVALLVQLCGLNTFTVYVPV